MPYLFKANKIPNLYQPGKLFYPLTWWLRNSYNSITKEVQGFLKEAPVSILTNLFLTNSTVAIYEVSGGEHDLNLVGEFKIKKTERGFEYCRHPLSEGWT